MLYWLRFASSKLKALAAVYGGFLYAFFSIAVSSLTNVLAVSVSPSTGTTVTSAVTTGKRIRFNHLGHGFEKLNRKVRVVIYARYSTEEQDASSIEDQIAFCKKHLESIGLADCILTTHYDKEVSGEIRNRQGIDHLWKGIEKREWDLIVAEDASRLFRNDTIGLEFVEGADDKGIRVMLVNDYIDTHDQGWEDRLRQVLRHHAKSNYYTCVRIRRRHEQLWKSGAAVVGPRPGYKRVPKIPASMGEAAQGPFYDQIDDSTAQLIHEIFKRVADGQQAWIVANFANQHKLPKCWNSKGAPWSTKDINALIRRTIYKGFDTHCATFNKKVKRSGKKNILRNEKADIWSREMPHLRIVSDELWQKANEVIDNRNLCKKRKSGFEHPLKGVPRDSRGPLSQIFVCGVCGAKMHMAGRVEGGYCCSMKKKGCWNHTTALKTTTHVQIGKAVAECLIADEEALNVLIESVQNNYQKRSNDENYVRTLEQKIKLAQTKQERLIAFILDTKNPARALNDQLQEIEKELHTLESECEQHLRKQASTQHCISREQVLAQIEKAKKILLDGGPEMAHFLKVLVPNKIRAMPYQQIDAEKEENESQKAVLRAEFEVQLFKLLPQELTSLLEGSDMQVGSLPQAVKLSVDLFEESLVPKLAREIMKHRYPAGGKKRSYNELAELLSVSNQSAFRATQLAEKMQAEGLAEPYKRITETPANIGRWKNGHTTA